MRKLNIYIIVLIGAILLTSCSGDTDSADFTPEVNTIVGKWNPIKEVDVCSTGSETISEYSTCKQKSIYTFAAHVNPDIKSDGTLTIEKYYSDDNECVLGSTIVGTWSLSGEDLTLTFGDSTETPTYFKITSNKLLIGTYDSDPNDTCDGGQLKSHYYTEFNRSE